MNPVLIASLWRVFLMRQDAQNPPQPPQPAPFADTLVVTAARAEQRLTDAVAPTTVLGREDLARSPGLTLDDQLRQVPGFSLLRRSSSVTAHPTSQGVSLRGLGPSGASRTLVLFDGVPLNDPFGGWVYWNRLPLSGLESVEVARGSLSQLYGSAAMGGAIQLLPRAPRPDTLEVTARGGDRRTGDLEVFASDAAANGNWGYTLSGRLFDTGGFYVVAPENRGAVDRPAKVDFGTLFGRLERGRYHLGANLFREERGNGTALQTNDTSLQSLDAGWSGDHWTWDAYGQSQRFRSTFSRLLPDRSREFLTARQDFATTGWGGSTAWRSGGGLLAGADLRRASWTDQDQTLGGVYAQQTLGLTSRLDLLLGSRLDLWRGARTRTSFNPRLGALFRASDAVTLRASAYRGFRAPTLDELYRPFQVGNVQTLANPDLGEETLKGAEIGADFHPTGALFARLNAFRNRIDGAVGNVTLSVTPQLITRRRENLDRVNADGLEAELRLQPLPRSPLWEAPGVLSLHRLARRAHRTAGPPGAAEPGLAGDLLRRPRRRPPPGALVRPAVRRRPEPAPPARLRRGRPLPAPPLRRPAGPLPLGREPVRPEGGHRPDADRDPGIAAPGAVGGQGPAVGAGTSRC